MTPVLVFHTIEQKYIAKGNLCVTDDITQAHVFTREGLFASFGTRLDECKDIVLVDTDLTPDTDGEIECHS